MKQERLHAADIDAIRLRFPRSGVKLIDNNRLRSHNAQYVLPIYALEQKVGIDDILYDRRGEPAIDALTRKVQVFGDDELDSEFPERYTSIVEIDSKGTTHSKRVTYAKGCPENPLTEAEIVAKFRWLAGSVVSETQVEKLITAVREVKEQSSVESLISLLRFSQQ
jgi:2-methylcitrate dehydratase PrpD